MVKCMVFGFIENKDYVVTGHVKNQLGTNYL